jgi:hypothetical protein
MRELTRHMKTKILVNMDQDRMKYIVCKGDLNGYGNYSKKNMGLVILLI